MERISKLIALALTIAVVGASALFEIAAAFCFEAKIYIAIWLITSVVIVGLQGSWRYKGSLCVALLVCLATLYLFPWNSRKPFLGSLRKIEKGMSPTEVQNIMGGFTTIEGFGGPPLAAYQHSDEARFNSDVGRVHYERDHVSKVEFSPD